MPTGLAVRPPVKWIRLPVYVDSGPRRLTGQIMECRPRVHHEITTMDPHGQRRFEIFELQ